MGYRGRHVLGSDACTQPPPPPPPLPTHPHMCCANVALLYINVTVERETGSGCLALWAQGASEWQG